MKNKKAAGYIRVSSVGQTENTSLPEQRSLIKDYAGQHQYNLIKIYADEGISGTTTEGRPDMLEALSDAKAGKFDVLIVRDSSRFGRNLLESLQNYNAFEDAGVKIVAVKEDLENTMMRQIKGIFDEHEAKKIKERMMSGKIAKAKRGVPVGRLPFGRTFDRKKEEWGVDIKAKQAIQWCADTFLNGMPMQDVAIEAGKRFDYKLSYSNLINILKNKSGSTRTVNFEQLDKPITYDIPPLLDDETIKAAKRKLSDNHKTSHSDTERDYLFSGAYLRCYHCGKALTGQMQHGKYGYYNHPNKKAHDDCDAGFASIPMGQVEQEVFDMIFDSIGDAKGFAEAIKDSIPDEDYIHELKAKENDLKKQLSTIKIKEEKLFQRSLEDIFDEQRIRQEKQEVDEIKHRVTSELKDTQNRLENLPDPEEVKAQAEEIRQLLIGKFTSKEHFNDMSFEENKKLIQFLFDGKDPEGREYGIYVIDREGRGQNTKLKLQLYGRLTTLGQLAMEQKKSDRSPFFDLDNYKRNSASLGNQRK